MSAKPLLQREWTKVIPYLIHIRQLAFSIRLMLVSSLFLGQSLVAAYGSPSEPRVFLGLVTAGAAGFLLTRSWAISLGMLSGGACVILDARHWPITLPSLDLGIALWSLLLNTMLAGLLAFLVYTVTEKLAFLMAINRATGDMIYLIDTQGRLAYVNDVAAELMGYRREQMVGRSLQEFVPLWYRDEAVGRVRSILRGDPPAEERIYVENWQGKELALVSRSQRFVMDGHTYVLGVAQNVTGQSQTERFFEAAFDAIGSLAVVHTPEGQIITCNQAFANAVGQTRTDLFGKSLSKLAFCSKEPEWQQAAASGRLFHQEVVLKDETLAAVSLYPIRDERGQLVANISLARDITAEKETEARMVQAAKLAAVGQTAAGVAHNLNNLLAAITVSAELLRLYPPYMADQVASDILEATSRGSSLIRNLHRLAGTHAPVHWEQVIVTELFDSILRLLEPQLTRQSIALSVEAAPNLAVRADLNLTHQVLVNLVLNAIQAMPEGGRLALKAVARPPGFVQILVSDTGPGIPPEHMNRLFTPFFTTKQHPSGTGLGLSTSLSMVQTMGGTITAQNRPDQGATFVVQLPGYRAESDHAASVGIGGTL